jgi:hypothetical protein
VALVAQLNARLQPIHRGEFFEDRLNEALDEAAIGEVSGGGTLHDVSGEIEYCDIEIQIAGSVREAIRYVIETLESLRAPTESKLHVEAEAREVLFWPERGVGGLFEWHRITGSCLPRMRLELRPQ